ncbi:hypothetical protein IV203_003322 [Nitzschia inconspicua]|uniref:Uncharacterized protein n=1 Tax=Nitzschia inconspicua TaxID=303405 RepID=A0A9K3PP55_9STRA|nr:hypothetical protein IV203_003322 [Nitzschia inconspicua]
MSTAVTPTPGRGGRLPLPTATTKLSQQLQAHNSLFDVDLMLQDMIALTTKMTDTLFGEDDRARKKMKISYQDHIRALTAAHSKMESSFKLLGLAFSAKNFQSGRRSETNVEIKRSYVNIPVEKRKAPEDVRQAAVFALAPPPKKSRKSAANPAPLPAESLEGKVREFVATTPPANGTIYDLRELVQALCVQASSPIYQLSAKKVAPVLKLLGKLVCGVSTLERRCTSYRRDLILPSTGDDGAAVGRRPLISIHNIPDLNGNVLVNEGMTEYCLREVWCKNYRLDTGL